MTVVMNAVVSSLIAADPELTAIVIAFSIQALMLVGLRNLQKTIRPWKPMLLKKGIPNESNS